MEDECAVTRTADDSPLIRRQILICLLRLLLRPEGWARLPINPNVNIARDCPNDRGGFANALAGPRLGQGTGLHPRP